MCEVTIGGIPVNFPFEPYDVQKRYMEKVVQCLQNGQNGVLESPTGTGKTLSLLCSSLAWLLVKKAQLQVNAQAGVFEDGMGFVSSLKASLKNASGKSNTKDNSSNWAMPKIIYSSRTHSQLTQAMQELKRSSYRGVKAAVLGSRDQMCIHPEVSKETNNANKVHLCQAKVKSRTCYFYTNVESKKDDRLFKDDGILDIEDLVKVGKQLKCCPYYMAKELKQNADIVFMPYNYLLDTKARKANGVELTSNVVILDEAHNIERICEESASLQIRTTDVALCIDEITHVMKSFVEDADGKNDADATIDNSQPKDFTADDLCILKAMLLELETAIDEIPLKSEEGVTFPGSYIFDLLAKAKITDANQSTILILIDNLVQFLTTANGQSPFQRKGVGLQKFSDLLHIIYSSTSNIHKERVKSCYKVHCQIDDKKVNKKNDSWAILKGPSSIKSERVISYWCFSPGFGMKQLLEQNIRSIILTSGTLAPLKPLISELGIPIDVQLENPHIIKENQICVKIIGQGPDSFVLNSNYENRNNPKYISSLGRTILSFCRVIPDGLLVFFPSYPILAKCQQDWQNEGIWSSIAAIKPIYVEPQRKETFTATMTEYYSKLHEPNSRGACFMAVCRGKVSEGLDFADMNGRAVIITGLPFPPLKDPRIILKKKYLDELRTKENEFLSGNEWYSLEASRAVNQAIGRVIRHKDDYGAILLCDSRFNNPRLKQQLSSWLKNYIKPSNKFGESVGDVCRFFKNAERTLPSTKLKPLLQTDQTIDNKTVVSENMTGGILNNTRNVPKHHTFKNNLKHYPNSNEVYADFSMEFYKNATHSKYLNDFKPKSTKDLFNALDTNYSGASSADASSSASDIHTLKRNIEPVDSVRKKKLKMKSFGFEENIDRPNVKPIETLVDFVKAVKSSLNIDNYKEFQLQISSYKSSGDYNALVKCLTIIFLPDARMHYLVKGIKRFLKDNHKKQFDNFCLENLKN